MNIIIKTKIPLTNFFLFKYIPFSILIKNFDLHISQCKL